MLHEIRQHDESIEQFILENLVSKYIIYTTFSNIWRRVSFKINI